MALFALGGVVAGVGGAVAPAEANESPARPDCVEFSVWLNWSHDGRNPDYVHHGECVTSTPWRQTIRLGDNVDLDSTVPEGLPSGAGYQVGIPLP